VTPDLYISLSFLVIIVFVAVLVTGYLLGERAGKRHVHRQCERANVGQFTFKGGEIGFEFNIPRY
jgi:hypothetical protein